MEKNKKVSPKNDWEKIKKEIKKTVIDRIKNNPDFGYDLCQLMVGDIIDDVCQKNKIGYEWGYENFRNAGGWFNNLLEFAREIKNECLLRYYGVTNTFCDSQIEIVISPKDVFRIMEVKELKKILEKSNTIYYRIATGGKYRASLPESNFQLKFAFDLDNKNEAVEAFKKKIYELRALKDKWYDRRTSTYKRISNMPNGYSLPLIFEEITD